jgi:hypothetical protein
MDSGMLWFDNNKQRDLTAKVSRAAEYFQKKYGQLPTLCFVHPSMMQNGDKKFAAGKVEIRIASSVLPNHFWIGINGKKES